GHDAQQRRLAGAVDAEHPDLGVGVEGQVDILQDLPVARIGLGETLHVIDELTGHQRAPLALLRAASAPDVRKSALMERAAPPRARPARILLSSITKARAM